MVIFSFFISYLLQSHKIKKELKRRERTSNHPDHLEPKVPESKPKAHLKPLTERHVISDDPPPQDSEEVYTHDPPQHHSGLPSHTHAPPTVNLNINLHTPANHTQPLNLSQKETILSLVSQALQWDRPDLFNPPFLQKGYPFYPYVHPNSVGQMGLAPKAVVSSPAPRSGVVQAVDKSVPQRHAGKHTPNTFAKTSFKNHSRLRQVQKHTLCKYLVYIYIMFESHTTILFKAYYIVFQSAYCGSLTLIFCPTC